MEILFSIAMNWIYTYYNSLVSSIILGKIMKSILQNHKTHALLVFVFTIFVLFPYVYSQSQHGDEKQYTWKGWYYLNQILHLDFHKGNSFIDPGFDPVNYWAVAEPYGSHLIYAIIMRIGNLPPPALPYSYIHPTLQGPKTSIPENTLYPIRLIAIVCAATGLAFITYRFGWVGLFSSLAFLAIPSVRSDLSRAWAEGPLMLGFGLCALSYKSRWFPFACGLIVCFKLTGLIMWPLIFITGSSGKPYRFNRLISIFIALIIYSILTPVSWFVGGPGYLFIQIAYRISSFIIQSHNSPAGIFLPTRYLWPVELLLILLVIYFIFRLLAHHHHEAYI